MYWYSWKTANVSRYTLDDLKELIGEAFPEMAEGPRDLAFKIFEDREKEMQQTLEEYYRENNISQESTLDEF